MLKKFSVTKLKILNKNFGLEFLILGLLIIGLSLGFNRWAYDDPFISYRYAENISRGLGFVYNPGDRILSTTTPLLTLILALGGLLGFDLHLFATSIGIISLAVGGLFIFDLSRTWLTPKVGWAGLLLYPTFPLLVSTIGSETPFYLALSLGAFAFYGRKRLLATLILGALATLARPDGALVLIIIGVDYLLRERGQLPWKPILAGGSILLAWVIFAWIYFGSPIPVTLGSKQSQGMMAISQSFPQGLLTTFSVYSSWPYILAACLGLVGIIYAIWRQLSWVLILLWSLLYFLAYTILGVSSYFWYYASLVPGIVVAVGLGINAVAEIIESAFRERKGFHYLSTIVPAVLMIILFAANSRSLWQMSKRIDTRYDIYRVVGEWLQENTRPSERIGSLEVGIMGYFANREMVDFAGLLQPTVAEQFDIEATYEDAAIWAITNFSPQYIVLQDGLLPKVEEEVARQNCKKTKRFIGAKYSYDWDISIYSCDNKIK